MKIILEATDDVSREYGGLKLEASKGERLELSPAHAEIALATGSFRFVNQKTENEIDEAAEERAAQELETRRADLMKQSKDDLIAHAKDLPGYKSSMTKEQLIDLLLAPQPPVTITDAQFTPPANGENTGE